MAELINTFSWSVSSASDFAECRRKRYLSKYAMWNGWKADATELQRTTYRLNKMQNRFSLRGNAVEKAVLWIIHQTQAGRTVNVKEAYEAAAKPYLNRCWIESREKKWKADPKKFCCLQEHYYSQLHNFSEKEMTSRMIKEIYACLDNFMQKALPRLKDIAGEQEIPVTTVESGDPESFEYESIKIYAIPDYVYWNEGILNIHDWKSGKPTEGNVRQMGVYGLWANLKRHAPIEKIRVHLEYLQSGEVKTMHITERDLQSIREFIKGCVSDMAEYLVDADIRKNEPLPKENWDMPVDQQWCKRCKFYELCAPELESRTG